MAGQYASTAVMSNGGSLAFWEAARRPFASPSGRGRAERGRGDRKSTRLNSSHQIISYAVFCLEKKQPRILRTCHIWQRAGGPCTARVAVVDNRPRYRRVAAIVDSTSYLDLTYSPNRSPSTHGA